MNENGYDTDDDGGEGNAQENQTDFDKRRAFLEEAHHYKYDGNDEKQVVVGPKVKGGEQADANEMPKCENG